MGKVSNRFFIQTIKDGQSISAVLMATSKLTQMVSATGDSCTPNWNKGETGAINPVVYAYTRLNGLAKAPTSGTWSYNGSPLTFDGNGKSDRKDASGASLFELTTYSVGSVQMPGLRIIRNLANAGNSDNDVISYTGSLEIGGSAQEFNVDIVVRITTMVGTGLLATAGGDTFINSDRSADAGYTAYVYAQLFEGTTPVTGLTTKWYREGIDTAAPFKQGVEQTNATTLGRAEIPAHSYYTSITASDINDVVVLRCDFYRNTEKIASVWHTVDDQTDPEEMFIVSSTGSTVGQSDIQLRATESVTLKAWMGYQTNMYSRHPDYNSFKCLLTDAGGAIIRSGAPIPTGKTPDSDGYFDITGNSVSILDKNGTTLLAAGVGGQITVSYDDVDTNCGGGLGGIIVAEHVTTT